MSGPQTINGRALLSAAARPPTFEVSITAEALRDAILAIEREAVAAFLASPEAAEGLARALHVIAYPWWDDKDAPPVMDVGDLSNSGNETAFGLAAAILAAWQQERAK